MMLVEYLLIPMSHFLLLWWCLTICYAPIKRLRGKRGALNNNICLEDLVVFLVLSFLLTIVRETLTEFYPFLMATLVFYYIVLLLDALLFVQFRIEVNKQTILWFFNGTKGLIKSIPILFEGLKKFPLAIAGPLLLVLFFFMDVMVYQAFLILLFSLLLVLFRLTPEFVTNSFFSTKTLLLNIFQDEYFDYTKKCSDINHKTESIDIKPDTQVKSSYYGTCKNANVILITLESLGCYINPYKNNMAHSIIANKLYGKAWFSENHYTLCPNTTVATNQIYSGCYSNNPYNRKDSLFPGMEPKHLKNLKKNGYKTFFVDGASLKLFNFYRLIKQIGFDRVWGGDDIPEKEKIADYSMLNIIDDLTDEINEQPFFLHIINDQTHMPYQVIDRDKYNKQFLDTFNDNNKSLYLNAIEEVDGIIDTFLDKLAKKVDMENTILIFTGDHGESFGEFGYYFHSNSVIEEQLKVPFFLYHPKLTERKLEHSCHFDIFPTLFDLLGIEYQYKSFGKTLGTEQRNYSYFAHSATLKGNLPANFCWIKKQETLWVDQLFGKTYCIKDKKIKKLGKEKQEYNCLLGKFLLENGLLI